MKRYIYLLLIFTFFPVNVFAAVLQFNGAFVPGCQPQTDVAPTLHGISGMCQKYAIDKEVASCIDPLAPNPSDGAILSETTLTASNGPWAKGLIALTNAGIESSLSEFDFSDAYRIYTIKSGNSRGNFADYRYSRIMSYSDFGTPVGKAVKIGLCAYNGTNCDGVDLSKYLPQSALQGSENGGAIKITKTGQNVTRNGNSITVVADVEVSSDAENININNCKAEGFNCQIINNNQTNFQIQITGTAGTKPSVKACVSLGSGGDLVTELILYEYNPTYQRFVKLANTGSEESEDCIEIKLPSICDDPNISTDKLLESGCCESIDPSTLIEGSKEEELYIDQCGPIVYIENECGADSCNDSTYKDFTHSYVRQKTMKSIMRDLDNGNEGKLGDYLDNRINDYCGIYVTENVDTLMPATAISVSGQFFIFDKYNDLNCTTEISCLRQPYISGKVKSTFFTNYKKWKSDYESAKSSEISTYNSWQSAVNAIAPAYQSKINAQNAYDNCAASPSTCTRVVPGSCVWDSVKQQQVCSYSHDLAMDEYSSALNSAKNAYDSAISNEKSTQSSYKNAVARRISLQESKNKCVTEEAAFKNNFEYDFAPTLEFLYSQTSLTEGTKEYSMKMVSNTSSIKYWPNTTTASMSNVDYLGQNSMGLDSETATNPKIDNLKDEYQRQGVYLVDEKGTTATYRFPDSTHDSCSGAACTLYEYNTLAYTSIKTKSNDARDPYNKISNPDEISKIYFYRPEQNTFALMNTGEYKTINYEANDSVIEAYGLEVGYVYNLQLTAFKGKYETNFKMSNVGFRASEGGGFTQKLIDEYVNEKGYETFQSICNYCNEEMAFKRYCPECDPEDPGDFQPQFYYRTVSLSDVTPNDRVDGSSNWADAKGKATEQAIQAVSGVVAKVDLGEEYLALASLQDSQIESDYTYLADSNNYYDIYDDESRYFLEYEIDLTPQDMQLIKKNSARSSFDYSKMNLCSSNPRISKDIDTDYCFTCTPDMKECQSSFVTTYFADKTDLNTTRNTKWKYFVNGGICKGSIDSCLGGKYPDPVFVKSYIAANKNWP